MILEHTTHAGYIRQDDVYTDENGVNYTVCQDTDAEDPRSWLSHEEAALVVINADRNTRTDNIDDYDDNHCAASTPMIPKVQSSTTSGTTFRMSHLS